MSKKELMQILASQYSDWQSFVVANAFEFGFSVEDVSIMSKACTDITVWIDGIEVVITEDEFNEAQGSL